MKKLFTLIAATLLSSGAFAQTEWKNLVVNGDMEGAQDPTWSSFWCHEWPAEVPTFDPSTGQEVTDSGQFDGFAFIVEDPDDPTNHCARVIVRSEAEADEAGNKTTPENSENLASWDCQFLIYANEQIPSGKELRLTMRVKAQKAGSFETQAHQEPGSYNFYQMFGDIKYTTEWTKVQVSATISTSQTQEENDKFMQSVAFNLSTMTDGNVIYFDDVKLEMRDPKGPEEFEGWFNLLRHGTLSEDAIGSRTNFTGRMGEDNVDRKAIVVDDPLDGQPALTVKSIGWNVSEQKAIVDDEGNPVLDDEGNPTYETINLYIKENGDTVKTIDDWRTQFFVTTPHKFVAGSKYRLKMWARADVPSQIDTQVHAMPGSYIHWQAVGSLNLTEEWQLFEFDDQEVSSSQSGNGTFQTIAFNCNKVKDQPVNYYFRFEEFSANLADISDSERTLSSEAISLPVPEPGKTDGTEATIDFAKCLDVLEATSFENLIVENMSVVSGENDEQPTFRSIDTSAGFYIADNGWLGTDQDKLAFEFDDVKDSDTQLKAYIYNLGDSFADKKVDTKFRYEFNKWFYVFDVALIPEDTFNGVSDVKLQPQQTTVYDLMGRRVQQPAKGLYIIDGKKRLVK